LVNSFTFDLYVHSPSSNDGSHHTGMQLA